jgi:RNA polymerase sigma-70 factor (ECF subfamily)
MIGAALMVWEDWVTSSGITSEILAVQRGDRDAFASLMARYQNRLYRYLLRLVRETATAEDLFQQTWLKVLESIHRFDPKRNFEAWLFAVARNLTIDHLRRLRPQSLDELSENNLPLLERFPAQGVGALEKVLSSEQATLVQQALESQPAAYREVLSLRFEEEMKLEEIAEVLAIPLSTVKSRLGRALERLRVTLLRFQSGELTP